MPEDIDQGHVIRENVLLPGRVRGEQVGDTFAQHARLALIAGISSHLTPDDGP